MESLVKLRLVADELKNNETRKFISTFMKQYGSQFILKAIFNEFSYSINSDSNEYLCNCDEILLQMNNHSPNKIYSNIERIECNECGAKINKNESFWHCKKKRIDIHSTGFDLCKLCIKKYKKSTFRKLQINKMNNIVSNIINVRQKIKKSKNENNVNKILKFDKVIPELISEIASFLPFHSYFHLQRTNRKLYIGCNTPFNLHTFDVINNNHSFPSNWIGWNKLKVIKSLSLNRNQINNLLQIKNNNKCVLFNNLNTLTIDNLQTNSLKPLQKCNDRKYINFENIENLSLSYFGDSSDISRNTNDFLQFLSVFRKVKNLNLNMIKLDDIDLSNNEIMKNLFPNIKHIKARYVNNCKLFWKGLIENRGSQIISLECRFIPGEFEETSHLYSNLQKLSIRNIDGNRIKIMSDNLKCCLKEICMILKPNIEPNDKNIEKEIKNLMKSQIKLTHIKIGCKYNICNLIMNGIIKGLWETNSETKRDLINFTFDFNGNIDNGKKLMSNIQILILNIQNCQINDFMICCKLNINLDRIIWDDNQLCMNYFKKNYLVKELKKRNNCQMLTISNK